MIIIPRISYIALVKLQCTRCHFSALKRKVPLLDVLHKSEISHWQQYCIEHYNNGKEGNLLAGNICIQVMYFGGVLS